MNQVHSFSNTHSNTQSNSRLVSYEDGTRGVSGAAQSMIRFYQKYVSYVLGSRCRFYPSCSNYAHECLSMYPLKRAVPKLFGRLLRCQPWHPGGIDLP